MKNLGKKLINLFLVFVTMFNTVASPLSVFASNETKGDLKLEVEGETLQYVKNNNGSVSATSGSFTNPGDVEVRKSVTKLDDNGNYEVKFEARGKRTSDETPKTGDIYAVIVFDRSNSMKDDTKWSNAKTASKNFVKGLHEKYASAQIAMVTFGSKAKTTRQFAAKDFSDIKDYDLFGYQPYSDYDSSGGTNLQDGLNKAYSLLSKVSSNAKKYVLVISDGQPTYYYDDNNSLHSDGTKTTKTNLDQTFKAANTLKNIAEIFTIGYDLPTGNICNNCYPYNNYTAETVLKNVASKESNYYGSNVSSIVSVINNVLQQTTVYSPAATNLVITDNIGSNFTSLSDTDNDRVITLTLSETTRLDSDAWQEVGKFTITIDKDSETGWHQTNNNFTYTYDEIDTEITCTKNPEVYWVEAKYDYRIEYYYDGVIDNSKTESSTAYKDSVISISDEKINANLKTGYKFVSVNPTSKEITIKNSGENVIKVYYEKESYNYTVEYYYDGVIDNSKTEINDALYQDEITSYTDKFKTGYKFEKVETLEDDKTLPLTITTDNTKNVIRVYYITDEDQTKTLKYTVEYYKDNVLQEKDTEITTKTVQVLESDTLTVNKKSINTTDKYYGYKFVGSNPSVIPDTIETNGVIKIYYEIDDGQTKTLKYTVEYYKDNVLQENDTEIITKTVQVLESDTLTVNKKSINTTDKYDGYKFVRSNPSVIPNTIETNGVIKIYYEKDTFNYTVEYYYDGVIDNTKTDKFTALYQDEITSYTDKNKTGYKLEKVETTEENDNTLPLVISSKEENNIIKVYYVKNSYGYKVEYYYDGLLDDSKTYTASAKYQDVITSYPSREKTGYSYEKDENVPLTIGVDTTKNIIKVYYVSNIYDYTIYHVEKDNETNILDTDKGTANYEDVITVSEKEFTGFTYDSKDKDSIKIDTTNNVAYVYYTRNAYDYTIYHVEKDNETNILGSDKGTANYEDVITVSEKEFTGFTFDSKDKDSIKIDTTNNVAYVYYTRNAYKYTIEYYKENINGKYDLVEEDTVIKDNVLFGQETTFDVKEYENYTYDESQTENANSTVPSNNDLVIRLYYNLNESKVIVHYVVKVDDNYIPFDIYGRDEFGNILPDFSDVLLEDDIFKGKIGTEFTTVYRDVKDYTFIGIYDGNILEDSNLEKLSGTKITSTIQSDLKEYTYVYEVPMGDGEELPPQTGVEQSFNYINYIMLIALVYIIKKYFDLISIK